MNDHSADDLDFVRHILADQYGKQPVALVKLQHYSFDWRGIYRVDYAQRPSSVLRLIRDAATEGHFRATADLLHHLEVCGYPAQRACTTQDGGFVGRHDDWRRLMVTYVEGELIPREPEALRRQAEVMARLHALPAQGVVQLSRLHPNPILGEVETALAPAMNRLPHELRDMNMEMLTSGSSGTRVALSR